MSDIRLTCIIPGCRRTRGQRKGEPPVRNGEEWICGDHWREVPAYLRRRKSRFVRLYRRLFGNTPYWDFPAGSNERLESVRIARLESKAWALCKRAAIERSVGL